jgi:hypothetical protein
MVSVTDVAHAVGSSLLASAVAGRDGPDVHDVFVADPADAVIGQYGDLVLGVGLSTPAQAVELLQRCAEAGASGVVLRSGLVADSEVTAAARRAGLALLRVADGVSWAHLVWLLRGILERTHAPGLSATDGPGGPGVRGDLFALADAAAAIIDAPVTVEDNQSRVLAYSSGQAETDRARVSTIVGRRVPEDVVAHFRARGVFRRLARSSEPFLVPERADGTRPRLVVPVRAGGEWLGSIWAVVDGPVDQQTTVELRNVASVVALHLLHQRAQSELARRATTDRLRSALWQFEPGAADLDLPLGPWRVVELGGPQEHGDAAWRQEMWESAARRHGWAAPLLADLDGRVFALLTVGDGATPGSWEWLRAMVASMKEEDATLCVAAGGVARTTADLPRSRAEATELLSLVATGRVRGPSQTFEDAWDALTVQRATSGLDVDVLPGPLAALVAHDAQHHTAYVATLQVWLAHHREPRDAARSLVVHPNTLRYRMRQLQQIADLDLDRPLARLALQLQIEALAQGRSDIEPLPR